MSSNVFASRKQWRRNNTAVSPYCEERDTDNSAFFIEANSHFEGNLHTRPGAARRYCSEVHGCHTDATLLSTQTMK